MFLSKTGFFEHLVGIIFLFLFIFFYPVKMLYNSVAISIYIFIFLIRIVVSFICGSDCEISLDLTIFQKTFLSFKEGKTLLFFKIPELYAFLTLYLFFSSKTKKLELTSISQLLLLSHAVGVSISLIEYAYYYSDCFYSPIKLQEWGKKKKLLKVYFYYLEHALPLFIRNPNVIVATSLRFRKICVINGQCFTNTNIVIRALMYKLAQRAPEALKEVPSEVVTEKVTKTSHKVMLNVEKKHIDTNNIVPGICFTKQKSIKIGNNTEESEIADNVRGNNAAIPTKKMYGKTYNFIQAAYANDKLKSLPNNSAS